MELKIKHSTIFYKHSNELTYKIGSINRFWTKCKLYTVQRGDLVTTITFLVFN